MCIETLSGLKHKNMLTSLLNSFPSGVWNERNRRCARAVDWGSLLRSCILTGTEGSNPSISAIFIMTNQTTILQVGSKSGIGLHSGELCSINLKPAPANTGIVFVVNDVEIPAIADNAYGAGLCSGISKDGIVIKTVEHLMSALRGNNIDNVYVEVFGPEIPLLDGSSLDFVRLIKQLGIWNFSTPRETVVIDKTITVGDETAWCKIEPSDELTFDFEIHFDHPLIGTSSYSFNADQQKYNKKIAPARTFGFSKDAQKLTEQGLALGATLKSVIVLTDQGLASGPLRYDDEFVRHKILDAIGDTALVGFPFKGKYTGFRAGHELNIQLAKEIRRQYQNQ